ncbi:MAG: BREX system Lon protease-like protein BrxL [Saprospiraceae bacterium]|nr:BREX system Lon protease-like protein BrxL [Saprospiraceae bacterium]MBP6565699.1 BREX system Lon protease-like protein BrxL [Saprospiraceae bacterium]
MSLQSKISILYDGKVVKKSLAKSIKTNAIVPTYVLEYLLGQHCASFDEDIVRDGLEKVKAIIANNYVNRDEAELIKSKIREGQVYRIIDKIEGKLNDKRDRYEVTFTNLGIKNIPVNTEIISHHPKLLTGGVWAIISINYLHQEGGSPWIIEQIKPIQISNVDIPEFITLRKEFTTEEWKQLLLQTLGLNPDQFSDQQALMQFARLIPFCERNYNLIELGPKGTGKSHVYSEFSPHGILISGGEVTTAKLFVNNASNTIGLVGVWDTVAFDEFAGKDKKVSKDLVDIMKNYMANKSFSRGKDSIGAEGSMVFVGNTKHSVPYMMKHADLFEPLPESYYDSAFLDRIHFYLPGWRVDIIRSDMFTDGYGFIVDYFAEILHHLRTKDYSGLLEKHFVLDNTLTTRDKTAIYKTFGGLMKILYPHQEYTESEAKEILDFAIEGRRRVKVQLEKMDETFREVETHFRYTQGKNVIEIITLEEIEFNLANKPESIPDTGSSDTTAQGQSQTPTLEEKSKYVKDGQTGISYKNLFKDYLFGSKEIHITDPYIVKFYQIKNLYEFMQMIYENKPIDEEVVVKLFTKEDTSDNNQEAQLIQLQSSLEGTGIDFHYDLNLSSTSHERFIDTDLGWTIILGRGLDIFQLHDFKNPFNLSNNIQEKRMCKEFNVTYKKR